MVVFYFAENLKSCLRRSINNSMVYVQQSIKGIRTNGKSNSIDISSHYRRQSHRTANRYFQYGILIEADVRLIELENQFFSFKVFGKAHQTKVPLDVVSALDYVSDRPRYCRWVHTVLLLLLYCTVHGALPVTCTRYCVRGCTFGPGDVFIDNYW